MNTPILLLGFVAWTAAGVGASAQSGPRATPELVARVVAASGDLPPGPLVPTWDSIKTHYRVPEWFRDAKFGLFIHWGVYAVPAHASEWYAKHMYGHDGVLQWHTEHFGPPDRFGYKDFIPRFQCEKFNPDGWATLFRRAGAKIVIPTAIHHDGFALWDSTVNPWNAKQMGPRRDLIGALARAVRQQGMKFGVSPHGIEHFTFIQPKNGLTHDHFDPAWAGFYSVADRSDAACERFLDNWVAENLELIDRYQPDILWFDNGVNSRVFDPLKLRVAAYYYNCARAWEKEVSLSSKHDAFLAGSILDFERRGRAPKDRTDFVWQVDEPVLYRFGYTEGSPIANAESIVRLLVDSTSKNGGLLLNISPKADGTIPERQQRLLLDIGAWLDVNGEAIYGTRPWRMFREDKVRFTTKADTLYAIHLGWPGEELVIAALAADEYPEIGEVRLIGHPDPLDFVQHETGLQIVMPKVQPCDHAFTLRITKRHLPVSASI